MGLGVGVSGLGMWGMGSVVSGDPNVPAGFVTKHSQKHR